MQQDLTSSVPDPVRSFQSHTHGDDGFGLFLRRQHLVQRLHVGLGAGDDDVRVDAVAAEDALAAAALRTSRLVPTRSSGLDADRHLAHRVDPFGHRLDAELGQLVGHACTMRLMAL